MLAEFPTIAELLALAVAAGEGAVGALERVTRISRGELARELRPGAGRRPRRRLAGRRRCRASRAGPACRRWPGSSTASRSPSSAARRWPTCCAPRPSTSARPASAALLEAGGRKEIAMMVPVVFLVLPVTVLFALFPGFYGFSFAS